MLRDGGHRPIQGQKNPLTPANRTGNRVVTNSPSGIVGDNISKNHDLESWPVAPWPGWVGEGKLQGQLYRSP